VPNNGNWGNISSLAFDLDFDKNPVLAIYFDQNACAGGYYLQINVAGSVYYVLDNTFNFDTLYLDINKALAEREDDGPPAPVTGVKSTRVYFGATMGDSAGTPKVVITSAAVYQLTEGSGTPYFGELDKPVLAESGRVVTWAAVDNAQEYTVVAKNEAGVLETLRTSGLSYDGTKFIRAGVYTVEVTAMGANYYNSETSAISFEIAEDIVTPPPETTTPPGGDTDKAAGCGCGGSLASAALSAGMLALLGAAAILIKRRRG
jgi:hypothetical protein